MEASDEPVPIAPASVTTEEIAGACAPVEGSWAKRAVSAWSSLKVTDFSDGSTEAAVVEQAAVNRTGAASRTASRERRIRTPMEVEFMDGWD